MANNPDKVTLFVVCSFALGRNTTQAFCHSGCSERQKLSLSRGKGRGLHLGNTRVTYTAHANGRPEVNQITSYDPYGFVTNQSNWYPTGVTRNKMLYNGKEIQDETLAGTKLDWYDYGARLYDPSLGRWHTPDPLAELGRRWSQSNTN